MHHLREALGHIAACLSMLTGLVLVCACRYAIAYAVLRHLSSAVDCRTLFATHFHPLASTEFRDCPRVALGHMAALVKEAHGVDPGSIAFLYELQEGACPKSYGLQV